MADNIPPPQADLLRRLELAQNDCLAQGQTAAAILLQDARSEIIRLQTIFGIRRA